ncbi:serine hydrolase domain-containing protein [Leptospira idonii]|uniref:Class A beta-lactamase-related serine hydrolase n=1 Tax=Leptospira idonii TaxID=1193500 RepID=A0A4R9M1B6_9LEPT|nr:serine hydrolase domain-containing protein [Leptospira idonii]TGN19487.1 class A beta-lactamase-related serine hydrolase [Leptospira idonii]
MKKFPVLFSRLGVVLFFCFVILSCGEDSIGSLSEEMKQEIRTRLKQENFQGVVLISKGSEILFRETIYHKRGSLPKQLYRKHNFPLGEVSKPFTAYAIKLLLKEKKIKETDAVKNHLPWFPYPNISIENLLRHTSGLPKYIEIDPDFDVRKEIPKRDQIKANFLNSPRPAAFPPGEYWKYTRIDYLILGYLIEELSGKSYASFIKEKIFLPLEMKHSSVDSSDSLLGNSGILSNPEDLVLWKEELSHPKLLNAKEIQSLFQKTVLSDPIASDSIYFGEGMYLGEYFHWAYGKERALANLFYQDRKSDVFICLVSPWGGSKGDLSSYKSILTEVIFGGKKLRFKNQTAIKDKNEIGIDALMKDLKVPGLGIAVYKNFGLSWKKNFGIKNAKTGEKITDKTLFRAGSLSKTVTAVTAVKLAEEGKLNLYSNWNKKLKTYHIDLMQRKKGEYVNLDSLLSHTSGLTEKGNWDDPINENKKHLIELQDTFSSKTGNGLKLYYTPGSKSRYSGGGYSVIQEAITDITKHSFSRVIRDYVGQPLHWTRSTFRQNLTEDDDYNEGHDPESQILPLKNFVTPELGAGGLWTTPEEIGNLFLQVALATKGESEFVSESSAHYLLSPKMSAANLTVHALVGRGFFLNRTGSSEYFFHGGHTKGHKSLAFFNAKKGYGIVIMTNSENGSNLIWRILRTVSLQEKWDKFVN